VRCSAACDTRSAILGTVYVSKQRFLDCCDKIVFVSALLFVAVLLYTPGTVQTRRTVLDHYPVRPCLFMFCSEILY